VRDDHGAGVRRAVERRRGPDASFATTRRRRFGMPVCALVILLALVLTRPTEAASPTGACLRLRPIVDIGRTDVLGDYAEVDALCDFGQWSLQVGVRYTDVTHATWPVAKLSYETALDASWRLLVAASARERVGDYEANRLPEVTLQWKPPVPEGALSPRLDVSAGWLQSVQFGTQTTRAGAVATIATPTLRLGMVSAGASLQLGDYEYGTGQNSSFYILELDAGWRVSSTVGLELAYVYQQGFGTSPLVFDFVNLERILISWLHVGVGPDEQITLAASFFVPPQAPPATPLIPSPPSVLVRDASIIYERPAEGWSAGIGWHQSDGAVFLIATLR
jgi:hypothetical protein